jgi:hypothetical protein
MSTGNHSHPGVTRACWRCNYWAGFDQPGMSHSRCSRLNASPLQASPSTGCASWTPGVGDTLPLDWMPQGFKPWDGPRIYGEPISAREAQVTSNSQRPCMPCDQFAFDQKAEAAAWRATDSLLAWAQNRRD